MARDITAHLSDFIQTQGIVLNTNTGGGLKFANKEPNINITNKPPKELWYESLKKFDKTAKAKVDPETEYGSVMQSVSRK